MMLVSGNNEPGRTVFGPRYGSRADAAARRLDGPMVTEQTRNLAGFTWSIAEILRGHFKQSEYGRVVLPFVVLRRLDCLLESTKAAVLAQAGALPEGIDEETRDYLLYEAAGGKLRVYNRSRFTFATLKGQEATQLLDNLSNYITRFSPGVRDIFLDRFRFTEILKRLADAGVLWQVFERFAQIDLHPERVSNTEMGYLFEDLIRRFSEISNETAGEHFTPREVIRLIVDLVLAHDHDALAGSGIIRTVYDPAAGTGGMLALAEEAMRNLNSGVRVELFGQELNPESFGICRSDMLITGHNPDQIGYGNSLTEDRHQDKKFHYLLSNPPYGVERKAYQEPIRKEHETKGLEGRFGPGLPRVSDGQLLFLLHMVSKMREDGQGSRIGIVMNGSPLFTGGAGSGESEIRRWLLERDLVEAIVALPTELFYNTGIQTYVWLLCNRKPDWRRGKVQLIDASGERFWRPMRKSLGSKRREIPDAARAEIVRIYGPSPLFHHALGKSGSSGRCGCGSRRRPRRWRGWPKTRRSRSGGGGARSAAAGAAAASAGGAVLLARGIRGGAERGAEDGGAAAGGAGAEGDPGGSGRAGRGGGAESGRERPTGAGPGAARHRVGAADRGLARLCGARGDAVRAGRLDGRGGARRARRGGRPGGIRDQLQPLLLQVRAAAPAGGDRRRVAAA